MAAVATSTATAGISQATGNRIGSVRQLVSAATICLSPENQSSALLTAAILSRATRKQPRPAASSTGSTTAAGNDDADPASTSAAAGLPMATARGRRE